MKQLLFVLLFAGFINAAPPVSYNLHDAPPVSLHDAPPVSYCDLPPVSNHDDLPPVSIFDRFDIPPIGGN